MLTIRVRRLRMKFDRLLRVWQWAMILKKPKM